MSEALHDAIVSHIKLRFNMPERFDETISKLIHENVKGGDVLNKNSLISIAKNFRKDLEKDDWGEIKYVFKAIFVLIVRHHRPHLLQQDLKKFLIQYPEFREVSEEEQKLLLEFRNMMVISLEIIDPKNHKGEMMTLIGHLCGTVVVTGGGQTASTDRRVLIYERETGIMPRKLPERRRKIDKVLMPWTVSANQYIPNAAKSNSHSSSAPTMEVYPAKKGRFALPDTKSLLKCADSFWTYHRSLMEANQDIPHQPVKVAAVSDIPRFPPHDLFYTPHISVNPEDGTVDASKLRSFFANLPKIEGVFAPTPDSLNPSSAQPAVTRSSASLSKEAKLQRDANKLAAREYVSPRYKAVDGNNRPPNSLRHLAAKPPPPGAAFPLIPTISIPTSSSAQNAVKSEPTTVEVSADGANGNTSSCDASVRSVSESQDSGGAGDLPSDSEPAGDSGNTPQDESNAISADNIENSGDNDNSSNKDGQSNLQSERDIRDEPS